MFRRLLIANRGAIARRVVRACNDLGIESVAVYSEADAHAPYLSEASRAVGLPGVSAGETYLNTAALLEAVRLLEFAEQLQVGSRNTGNIPWRRTN